MVALFFNAEVFADAIIEVDDEVAGFDLVEVRDGCVVCGAPFFAAHFEAFGELCVGDDDLVVKDKTTREVVWDNLCILGERCAALQVGKIALIVDIEGE